MKISKIFVSAIILTIFGTSKANSQSLSDLFGGDLGSTITNMVEGVFSSSNITVSDMAGTWTSTGPAVCFQSDNLLQKAGGIAAASAIETKLAPYYNQYGLNNSTLTVQNNGSFTLNCGKFIKLTGTISPATNAQKGVFTFNFTALNIPIGAVNAYVQKTSSSMDVMFDASKLKSLLTKIGQFSGISIVQTVTSLLDSYDGLCVGFNFKGTSSNSSSSSSNNNGFNIGNILNGFGIGGGNNNSDSNSTNTQKESNQNNNNNNASKSQESISNSLNSLKGILGK